jgi:hypothetical protein
MGFVCNGELVLLRIDMAGAVLIASMFVIALGWRGAINKAPELFFSAIAAIV